MVDGGWSNKELREAASGAFVSSPQLNVLTCCSCVSLKASTWRVGKNDAVPALEELTKQKGECLAKRIHRMHRDCSYLSSGGRGRHPRKILSGAVKEKSELLGDREEGEDEGRGCAGEKGKMCKCRAAREQKGMKAGEGNSGDKTRQRQGSDPTNSAMESFSTPSSQHLPWELTFLFSSFIFSGKCWHLKMSPTCKMPLPHCLHLWKQFIAKLFNQCGRSWHSVFCGPGLLCNSASKGLLQGVGLRPGYLSSVGRPEHMTDFNGNEKASLLLFTCQICGTEPASTLDLAHCQTLNMMCSFHFQGPPQI